MCIKNSQAEGVHSPQKKEKCKEHDLLVKQRAHKRKLSHTHVCVCVFASVWHINHTKEFYKMQLNSLAEPKPKVVAVTSYYCCCHHFKPRLKNRVLLALLGKRLTAQGFGG